MPDVDSSLALDLLLKLEEIELDQQLGPVSTYSLLSPRETTICYRSI